MDAVLNGPMAPMAWLACACFAAAVGSAAFFCRDYFAWGFNWVEADIAEKLRRLRASTRNLRRYLIVWLIATAAMFAVLSFVMNSLIFGVLLSLFLVATPWYMVRRMAERHRQKIEDQLADSMVTLASAIRAGLSLAQSLEILAAQCPKPINAEFHQIVAEYKLGKPLDRTLLEAKKRLKSENFALFAAALLASHESGGRLNETVERIARSVLEMQRLERKVQSETAQARKSAIYMAIVPFIILIAYYFVDPVNTVMLFTTVFGQCLLAASLVLDVAAYFWARIILSPDI
jgi:tight adherence protein B